jgi:hypothetical protein
MVVLSNLWMVNLAVRSKLATWQTRSLNSLGGYLCNPLDACVDVKVRPWHQTCVFHFWNKKPLVQIFAPYPPTLGLDEGRDDHYCTTCGLRTFKAGSKAD